MKLIATMLLSALLAAMSLPVTGADTYPSRPVRLVVPFPPGGGTDIMARLVGTHLTEKLGASMIIDNRGGAGGSIGTEFAAKANPDGYTLLLGSVSTISMNPSLYPKLAYDTLKDLAPVALFASAPSVLVVPSDLPVKSLKDLITLAKAKPGQLNFASAGSGTASHLGSELLKMTTGIDVVHVPYKGTAPAITDVLARRVSMMIAPIPTVVPMVKAGQLRPLAVTSLARSSLMPDVPTAVQSGLADFEVVIWFGILAPSATPQPIIETLNRQLNDMARLAEVKERLAAQGAEPISSTPEEFAAKIRDDLKKWARVVQVSGAKLD